MNSNPADGCECEYTSDVDFPDLTGVGTPNDANCDGVDGEISNGVFVANGDDAASGSIDAPVLTITGAIAKAKELGRGAWHVATGVYQESLFWRRGLEFTEALLRFQTAE